MPREVCEVKGRSTGIAVAGLAIVALPSAAGAAQEEDLSAAVAWTTGSPSSAEQAAAGATGAP